MVFYINDLQCGLVSNGVCREVSEIPNNIEHPQSVILQTPLFQLTFSKLTLPKGTPSNTSELVTSSALRAGGHHGNVSYARSYSPRIDLK